MTRLQYDEKDREIRNALKKGIEDYKKQQKDSPAINRCQNCASKDLKKLSKFNKHTNRSIIDDEER